MHVALKIYSLSVYLPACPSQDIAFLLRIISSNKLILKLTRIVKISLHQRFYQMKRKPMFDISTSNYFDNKEWDAKNRDLLMS